MHAPFTLSRTVGKGQSLKVLQLFNNWKWTGPAEYACNLAIMLNREGIETLFACGRPPEGITEGLPTMARERGIQPMTDLYLDKHLNLVHNIADLRRLRRFVAEQSVTVIHTHLTNGHLLGALATRTLPHNPVIIRTSYDSGAVGLRDSILYHHLTDGLIVTSQATEKAVLETCRILAKDVRLIPAAIDTDRFDPARGIKNTRAQWGIAPDAPVVGIVARVQTHRRFEIFLEAIAEAVKTIPSLRVMVIGRGTKIRELAIEPSEKMGLSKHFIFTGYRKDDYVETLNCIDAKIFLVPGSDASCRAVREAMALGKPIIAANRGMLPEIVDHETNGLIIEDTHHTLAQAIIRLANDRALREKLGRNALEKAHTQFSLRHQVKRIVALYEEIIRTRTS